jgi:hypothetical protein
MYEKSKEVIKDLFGSTPSIGELNQLSMSEMTNDKDVYLLVKFNQVPYCKINTEGIVTYSGQAEKIKKDLELERTFFFRCSGMRNIMTSPRGKTNLEKYNDIVTSLDSKRVQLEKLSDKAIKSREKLSTQILTLEKDVFALEKIKDEIQLSETAKAEVRKLWIENSLGRRRIVKTKYTDKGLVQEDGSIEILSEFDGFEYVKNETRQMDFEYRLSGEFDLKRQIEGGEEIIDIKSRYDAESFFSNDDEEQKKGDAEQLDSYLILNQEATRATIANVLVNNSDDAIRREVYLKSLGFENGEMPKSEEVRIIKEQVFDFKNFNRLVDLICGDITTDADALEQYESFREVPLEMRVIKISRDRDEERLDVMKERLKEAFKYAQEKYKVV